MSSGKAKVKVKKQTVAIGGDAFSEIIGKLTGTSDADGDILAPLVSTIRGAVLDIATNIELLCDVQFVEPLELPRSMIKSMLKFVAELRAAVPQIELTPSEKLTLNNYFTSFKKEGAVRTAAVLAKVAKDHSYFDGKSYTELVKFLQDDMIGIKIFLPVCEYDCKTILQPNNKLSNKQKQIAYHLWCSIVRASATVRDTMTKPPIEPSEMFSVLIQGLEGVKAHLPECADAFKAIEQSAEIFRDGFDRYYCDYVRSESPSAIMGGFLTDLFKSRAKVTIKWQFNKIMQFISKQATNSTKMPAHVKQNLAFMQRMFAAVTDNKESSGADTKIDPMTKLAGIVKAAENPNAASELEDDVDHFNSAPDTKEDEPCAAVPTSYAEPPLPSVAEPEEELILPSNPDVFSALEAQYGLHTSEREKRKKAKKRAKERAPRAADPDDEDIPSNPI